MFSKNVFSTLFCIFFETIRNIQRRCDAYDFIIFIIKKIAHKCTITEKLNFLSLPEMRSTIDKISLSLKSMFNLAAKNI